jgi:hypothetical protein
MWPVEGVVFPPTLRPSFLTRCMGRLGRLGRPRQVGGGVIFPLLGRKAGNTNITWSLTVLGMEEEPYTQLCKCGMVLMCKCRSEAVCVCGGE